MKDCSAYYSELSAFLESLDRCAQNLSEAISRGEGLAWCVTCSAEGYELGSELTGLDARQAIAEDILLKERLQRDVREPRLCSLLEADANVLSAVDALNSAKEKFEKSCGELSESKLDSSLRECLKHTPYPSLDISRAKAKVSKLDGRPISVSYFLNDGAPTKPKFLIEALEVLEEQSLSNPPDLEFILSEIKRLSAMPSNTPVYFTTRRQHFVPRWRGRLIDNEGVTKSGKGYGGGLSVFEVVAGCPELKPSISNSGTNKYEREFISGALPGWFWPKKPRAAKKKAADGTRGTYNPFSKTGVKGARFRMRGGAPALSAAGKEVKIDLYGLERSWELLLERAGMNTKENLALCPTQADLERFSNWKPTK